MNDSFMYVLLVVLLLLSAFFSATETAISTINKVRMQKYEKQKHPKAKAIMFILDNFDRALTTILIGNNIVNIASSSIATILAVKAFGPNGAAIATGVMTFLILTFGEILPKCLARERSEGFSLAVSKIVRFFMIITYPLTTIFLALKKAVTKVNPRSTVQEKPSVTEQELKYIVENIEDEGVLEEQESQMVRSSLDFDEKTVQEILTPRVDMISIDIEDSAEKNREIIFNERYSRIPVCEGSCDNIIGILHTRDFLEAIINGEDTDIKKVMQPPFFIYKTKKLSSLLNDFKKDRIHLAIVTDDYGGTLGIVTMEDLLEQLVGDIWDEDEEIEHDYQKVEEDVYEISGDMSVRDVFDLFEIDHPTGKFKNYTVGGWALEKFSDIPEVGDMFTYDRLEVTVKEVANQRIIKVMVKIDKTHNENKK